MNTWGDSYNILDVLLKGIFYAVLAVLIAIALGAVGLFVYGAVTGQIEFKSNEQAAFERRDSFVAVCLTSERYSRDECIAMAGEDTQRSTIVIPMPVYGSGSR